MSEPLDIPDKIYFRIGEVSALLGVRPHVLRYWETEFPSLRPDKSRTNQRLYQRRDIELLADVKRLLYDEGYTIAGARKRLRRRARGGSSADAASGTAGAPGGAAGGDAATEERDAAQTGLQSPAGERIKAAAPDAETPGTPSRSAPDALREWETRYRALEQRLEAERATHRAFRARMREELHAIRTLAAEHAEGDTGSD